MPSLNWFMLPVAAFVPLIIGFIYYHPKVFGTRLANLTDKPIDQILGNRTPGRLILIYVFSLFWAYLLTFASVHQSAIFQLFFMDPSLADANHEYNQFISEFMSKYGDRHRSFSHGVIHGAENGLVWGIGFLGITTILQGKPLKPMWIHLGFGIICCALMGGLICEFL